MSPVKFNRAHLSHAFSAYSGTTFHCMSTARRAHSKILAHSAFDDTGEVGECPGEEWMQAMKEMRGLPYGGRWVNQARKTFCYWLERSAVNN